MSKKIFIGVVSVSLVTMLICAGLVLGIMYDYMGAKLDEQLADEAVLVEEGWLSGGEEYLAKLEERTDIGSRITLLSARGEVLYDSAYDTHKMENHMQREEVKKAIAEDEGFATRISYTLAQDMRYYAKMTADGNIIRISVSHNSRMRLLLDTSTRLLIVLEILLILSALISYRAARAIIKPINSINLDEPNIDKSYDELKPLLHRITAQNESIRKQMEKLRKSREEFNIITENMNEGFIIIDEAAEILTYNRGALRMLGAGGSAEPQPAAEASSNADFGTAYALPRNAGLPVGAEPQLAAEPPHDASLGTAPTAYIEGSVLRLNRSAAFRNSVSEVLSGQRTQGYIQTSGETYEIIASPVKDGSRISGAVLILIDVTEREKGERMRREFSSNVSHELKTPLTSIYGVSDMLAAGLVKAEDVKGFAASIKSESARMISLIDDIMKLSRLDESELACVDDRADLWETVRNVTDRLQAEAAKNEVELRIECDENKAAIVRGEDYIVDEIVHNLCENAIKYNRRGGSVCIKLKCEDDKCLLEVSDTGIGIAQSEQERIFERFYRADKSHSKKIGGTGLGLSIVKHGVQHIGGAVSLESREGCGTTVTVAFRRSANS